MSKQFIKWLQRLATQDTIQEEFGDDVDYSAEFPNLKDLYEAIYTDGQIELARQILKELK